MENEIKLLQVGDVLYTNSRWNGMVKHTIERVSSKQAFSGNEKFKREVLFQSTWAGAEPKNMVDRIGEYGYAYLETPELLAAFIEEKTISKAIRMFSDFPYHKHIKTLADAKKVIAFLESFKLPENENNTTANSSNYL